MKNIDLKNKVVGRHSQLCFIRRMLDKEITDAQQIDATNRDVKEKEDIFEKLEKIDFHIKSKDFIIQFDFSKTHDAVLEIFSKGYKTCVFQFDSRIENFAFSLLEEIREQYKKLLGEDKDKISEAKELNEKIDKQHQMMGWVSLPELGGLIKNDEEQHVWLIFANLHFAGKSKDISIETNIENSAQFELIYLMLSSLAKKDIEKFAGYYRTMNERLVKNQKITKSDGEEIEKLIEKGVLKNREIHEEYPDRL